MSDLRRGLIIVNTGPGKGKTTAAMGTALRAVGQGMRVLMLQFLKGSWHYGELDAVKAFGNKFVLKQMGRGFVKVGAEKPDPEDVRKYFRALKKAQRDIDLRPELYTHYYKQEFPHRFHDMMDTRRWGPGERIVFEKYGREMFEDSRNWIAERGIFADGNLGSRDYEHSILTLA